MFVQQIHMLIVRREAPRRISQQLWPLAVRRFLLKKCSSLHPSPVQWEPCSLLRPESPLPLQPRGGEGWDGMGKLGFPSLLGVRASRKNFLWRGKTQEKGTKTTRLLIS